MKIFKPVFYFALALIPSLALKAQTPAFDWQRTWNSSQSVQCREIDTDSNGNIYVGGTFRATVDLDPGEGVVSATSAVSYNGMLVKLTSEGLYLWSIVYPVEFNITAINCSASGDVLLGGRFRNPVDFDPGSGSLILSNAGLSDGFLARYTATGALIWAKSFGSEINEGILGMDEAPNGDIIVGGDFSFPTDFDPGVGEVILSTIDDSGDGFFSRFDANGNFISVIQVGGDFYNEINAAKVDPEGNTIVVGRFSENVLFDPDGEALEFSTDQNGMFIAKYNSAGDFDWAKVVVGVDNLNVGSAKVDAQSNIYVTGYFSGSGDFDPGSGEILLTDSNLQGELFMMKLDAAGNLIWAHQIGVPESQEFGMDLSVDANQNLFLTGIITGNVDFDLGPGVVNLPGVGSVDAFVLVMNPDAGFIWASRFGNNQDDFGNRILPIADGSVYVSGHRFPSGDSPHSYGYLYKYAPSVLNTSNASLKMFGIEIYPNPSKGIYNVVTKDAIVGISVFDATGKEIISTVNNALQTHLDLSTFNSGVYVLQITTNKAIHSARLIKE